ncbi:TonB-dependent siderophore receptor [Alcaligenes faecalis]|uniref:TonB-dependent siderophore receptor n=1 Tax=Alcaligenes faecalis TaxID=511 RepID=UPI000F67AB93|nr:TonB-dependent siderophore receptor [Alcaligenes faecalis]MBQ0218782.1 TonB-dependent siderophore receptor [Alcaligenes faecalis]RSE60623.1 TonB-dependent siderophore receptor [Alcaligenes faecalis]
MRPSSTLTQRSRLKLVGTITAGALGLVSSAHAAQTPEDETAQQPITLQAVTIKARIASPITEDSDSYTTEQSAAATRLPLSLRETPQSVSVVTQQRMQDQSLASVQDALKASTGISSNTLDTERVSFYSRGFSVDSFQYDGMPTHFVEGASFLDTAFYDRVEVVRGATGLLTGAGNPGASVNLVRKRPGKDLRVAGSVSAGSWDNYRGMADISTPLNETDSIRARLVGVYQDRASHMDLYRQKKKAFYGIIEADLSADTTLSLGFDYQDITPKGTSWGGLPLWYSDGSRADWSRSKTLAARWSRWDNTLQNTFANLEHRFDNGWSVRAAFNQQRGDSDARLFSGLGYPDRISGQGLLPVALASSGDTRQNNVDVMASGPFTLFGREHELVLGAMGSRRVANDHSTGFVFPGTPIQNFNDWSGHYPEPDFDSAGYGRTHTVTKQSAVYGVARFSLADPLKLILGGRLSTYQVDQQAPGMQFHYKKNHEFTPYAGLVYELDDNYSVYISHTQIFNPQSYRDRNNQVLQPTTGRNTEVGIKAEYLDGRLNASLALFETRLDQVAQIDTGYVLPDGTQAYYAADGTKSRGIDLELQGELSPGWNIHTGISHFTASDVKGERLNSQLPRTTARLFSTYRLPGQWNKLTVGGGLSWQSRFYQTATGPAGATRVEQSSYPLASLMARYEFNKKLSLSAHVDNLFDKKYTTMTGFYNQVLYGEPRRFMFNLNYQM